MAALRSDIILDEGRPAPERQGTAGDEAQASETKVVGIAAGSALTSRPEGRALRVGARAGAAPQPVEAARSEAAPDGVLAEEIRSLKTSLAEALAREDDTRADIASIKSSIHYLEAFHSITLPPKLDEMIGRQLTMAARLERSRRRSRTLLIVSVLFNVALLAVLASEISSGSVAPALSSAARQAQAVSADIAPGLSDMSRNALAAARSLTQ